VEILDLATFFEEDGVLKAIEKRHEGRHIDIFRYCRDTPYLLAVGKHDRDFNPGSRA
jgi:hypothetical protein